MEVGGTTRHSNSVTLLVRTEAVFDQSFSVFLVIKKQDHTIVEPQHAGSRSECLRWLKETCCRNHISPIAMNANPFLICHTAGRKSCLSIKLSCSDVYGHLAKLWRISQTANKWYSGEDSALPRNPFLERNQSWQQDNLSLTSHANLFDESDH